MNAASNAAAQSVVENKPPAPATDLKSQIERVLRTEGHQTFTAESLMTLLKLQSPKDPQKQAQTLEQINAHLRRQTAEGTAVEVSDGRFKNRLFFDEERLIEHAFIGGMGNVHYRFRSPLFRINIGVLSLFFIRDKKAGDWKITVRDTTIGRDYALVRHLRDGDYVIGSRPMQEGEKNYIAISGRYINKDHLKISLSGEDVRVEDFTTPNGTRIDLLSAAGVAAYQEAARAFLKTADKTAAGDPVLRGRFIMDQLLRHHRNYETAFFAAVVDSILIEG